jgi:hypothetical protein
MAFAGIWIEKGMGLIVPGYIPSPIGEVTEYHPSFVEWLMVLGIWAFGFFILTILLKGAIGILLGEIKFGGPAAVAPSEAAIMRKLAIVTLVLGLCGGAFYAVSAAEKRPLPAKEAAPKAPVECFESRKGASEVTQRDIKPGWPNVKCSPKTGAALWYGDPYDGTVPMGKMPLEKIPEGQAVVKPRSEKLALMPMCGTPATTASAQGLSADPAEGQEAGADPDHGSDGARPGKESPARPRPHLVPGLPPHDQAQHAGRPLRRPGQLRPAAAAVRQVPRRQAARLA